MSNWHPIEGSCGLYFVDELGQVESRYPGRKPHPLKPKIDRAGYNTVTIVKSGNRRTVFVHRLVAEAYLDNPQNKPEVNHKNGIKTDNRLENLEWVTHSENMQHAHDTGLCKPTTKVVMDDFLEMSYKSAKEAAHALGIKEGTCRNYLNGNLKNKTPLRYGEPIEVHVPLIINGVASLIYTRKVIRYI